MVKSDKLDHQVKKEPDKDKAFSKKAIAFNWGKVTVVNSRIGWRCTFLKSQTDVSII